jgi:CspA family cold shock protein
VQREAGRVRWFKEAKGYGRISADSGEIVFVHFSQIQKPGFRTLYEGQRVEFVKVQAPGPHGPRWIAEEVVVVGE